MDGKLILGKKEIPASHVYDCADSNGFLPLLKMHTLGHSLALNSQRYFDLSPYGEVPARKLKGLAYSEEEVEEAMVELPEISSGSIYY
jgi:predicted alternative tryptophan synthase beta-subunit